MSGALEQLYTDGVSSIDRRLILKPFPYGSGRRDLVTKYREDLLATAGFVVFLAGNKTSADGEIVMSDGVEEEFRLAVANGAVPLPIGNTGWMAEQLWLQVKGDWNHYMAPGTKKRDFNILNRPAATVSDVLDALERLIAANRKS